MFNCEQISIKSSLGSYSPSSLILIIRFISKEVYTVPSRTDLSLSKLNFLFCRAFVYYEILDNIWISSAKLKSGFISCATLKKYSDSDLCN